MKDKNLPNNYNSLSLEELTIEANKMIEDLENQEDLENSLDKYQDLIKLNNIIEKKFQMFQQTPCYWMFWKSHSKSIFFITCNFRNF